MLRLLLVWLLIVFLLNCNRSQGQTKELQIKDVLKNKQSFDADLPQIGDGPHVWRSVGPNMIIRFSPSGDRAAVADQNGNLHIFETTKWKKVGHFPVPNPYPGYVPHVSAIHFDTEDR